MFSPVAVGLKTTFEQSVSYEAALGVHYWFVDLVG